MINIHERHETVFTGPSKLENDVTTMIYASRGQWLAMHIKPEYRIRVKECAPNMIEDLQNSMSKCIEAFLEKKFGTCSPMGKTKI